MAQLEPDSELRDDYAALALIFAALVERDEVWRKGLEGWNVERARVTQEWEKSGEARGEVKGRTQGLRRSLLRLLRKQVPDLPGEVMQAVEMQANPEVLEQWFDGALAASNLDEVRQVLGLNGQAE